MAGKKQEVIMPNGSITLYKLIILYTLNKVGAPLPPNIISDFTTTHGYTNYFNLQNAFGELLESKLISEDTTYHRAYYEITDVGKQTLSAFGGPLSLDMRKEIDSYLQERKYEIIDETSFISDYHITADHTYMTSCTLREGNRTIFHVDMEVATESEAIRVCEKWQSGSEILYQTAIKNLL